MRKREKTKALWKPLTNTLNVLLLQSSAYPPYPICISYVHQVSCAIPRFSLWSRTLFLILNIWNSLIFLQLLQSLHGRFRNHWQEIPGLSIPFLSLYGKDFPIAKCVDIFLKAGRVEKPEQPGGSLVPELPWEHPMQSIFSQKSRADLLSHTLILNYAYQRQNFFFSFFNYLKLCTTYFPITNCLLLFEKPLHLKFF